MTMRVVAKFYPHTDAEVVQAKDALERFKTEVLADKCGNSVSFDVVETTEEYKNQVHLDGVLQSESKSDVKVVKIDGFLHFNK